MVGYIIFACQMLAFDVWRPWVLNHRLTVGMEGYLAPVIRSLAVKIIAAFALLFANICQ
jgi:hypothetical protein